MNSVLIIVKFNNNFDKYIFPLMLMVPRTSLFASIYLYIHESVFNNKLIQNNQNIKIYLKNNDDITDIHWYLPIGVYFDILSKDDNKFIELICDKSEDRGFFKTPIDNMKSMVQQRFKQGLATILNSTKFFVELPVKDMENYVSFATSTKYIYKGLKNFQDLIDKIYNKKEFRIPILFHYQNKMEMYCPNILNNEDDLLKDTILRCGFDNEIINNSDIIINGFNLRNIEKVPLLWAIKNLCYSDLFLHIVVK